MKDAGDFVVRMEGDTIYFPQGIAVDIGAEVRLRRLPGGNYRIESVTCPTCIGHEVGDACAKADAVNDLARVSVVLAEELREPAAPLPLSDVDRSGLSLALMGQGPEAESMPAPAFAAWLSRTFIRTDPA